MSKLKRRSFLAGVAGVSAAGALASCTGAQTVSVNQAGIPMRVLGRTGEKVPIAGFGAGLFGRIGLTKAEGAALVHTAIDSGITYLDAAPTYPNAHELIGEVMPQRRDEVFLISKVRVDNAKEAEELFTKALKDMKTDHVDLLYIHNVGLYDINKVMADDGVYPFVLKMKEKGLARFAGVTGHLNHANFKPVVEPGELDVMMVVLNFAHRYVYRFEDTVLPMAREHNMGIVAMKVLSGPTGYSKAEPPKMPAEYCQDAFRYVLEIDGVSTAVIGMYTKEDVFKTAQWAREYKPMTKEELAALEAPGKKLAAEWGESFGKV